MLDVVESAVLQMVLSFSEMFWHFKQVIRIKKLMGLLPPHSNYLVVFLRFRRTFAEVIMLGEASAHEFQPNYQLSMFEIGRLFLHNRNYSINSLLRLRVGTRIIYIYISDECNIPEVKMKTT